jgi:hypothetical protein
MEVWTSQSNPSKQIMLSFGCVFIGMVLLIVFRDFGDSGSNAMAGFLLGVLLLVIGVASFLMSGKQTVVVDPKARHITIEDSSRLRTKTRSIPFNDIVGISIGYLGKRSNFVTLYYLMLKLRSGEEYPLFSPGRFFEGGSDRSAVAAWRQRLEEYLGR